MKHILLQRGEPVNIKDCGEEFFTASSTITIIAKDHSEFSEATDKREIEVRYENDVTGLEGRLPLLIGAPDYSRASNPDLGGPFNRVTLHNLSKNPISILVGFTYAKHNKNSTSSQQ